ncbi:tol-pal system-associated acyl-CoA thioesterase [Rubellimicrobium rubrum]|uniref:Tol-pal system-associated acyl-CoA thioesterase n=1 Tax=Rubellimicrobium rubrum TaxID=2585369 RepID=A0A5C4MLZ3_9RHOB|nr:tol-pal system-associated acyl-CoA thioesterase [Rubellimicrobium rubrum]TNC46800.1 tol-pal system-associated acyl-CoA thioesterase [Rubellimicrobium rubrum]
MAHHFPVRVYYEDTDLAGVVYYANYLRFIERARTEWAREAGIDQGRLRAEQDIVFAVCRLEADYLSPARFDDVLDVRTIVEAMAGARIVLMQEIVRGELMLFAARVTLVAMDGQGRPRRIPAPLLALGP